MAFYLNKPSEPITFALGGAGTNITSGAGGDVTIAGGIGGGGAVDGSIYLTSGSNSLEINTDEIRINKPLVTQDTLMIHGDLTVGGTITSAAGGWHKEDPIEVVYDIDEGINFFRIPRESNDIMVFVNGLYKCEGFDWYLTSSFVEFVEPQTGRIVIRCK